MKVLIEQGFLCRAMDLEEPVIVFRHTGLFELDVSSVSVVSNDESSGARCVSLDFDTSPPPPSPPAASFPTSESCPLVEISMQYEVGARGGKVELYSPESIHFRVMSLPHQKKKE